MGACMEERMHGGAHGCSYFQLMSIPSPPFLRVVLLTHVHLIPSSGTFLFTWGACIRPTPSTCSRQCWCCCMHWGRPYAARSARQWVAMEPLSLLWVLFP